MTDFLGVDMQWHPEGWFYGVDGIYHAPNESYGVDERYWPPGQVYRPAYNEKGEHVTYRPESSPYKIEGGTPPYGSPGSFLGVDGNRYPANYIYCLDGKYHSPDVYYDIMTGKYIDPPPKK